MSNTITIQEIKDIIEASDCLDKISILASLENMSKPIDMKQPIEICKGCGYFKVECICQ